MDAAAETVKELSRTILPERPHQLAKSPDWKSRYPPDDSNRRCEEWNDTRLQYMTFVSEADRGVLFTRGYYDIRPEPPKPDPKEVNALARGGAAKKLSLSDYKNKKTGAAASPSPLDTTPSHTPRKSNDRASVTPIPEHKGAETKSTPDSLGKTEGSKPKMPNSTSAGRPRENIVVDMRYCS